MQAPSSQPQSDNSFKFNSMKNRVVPENFLKLLLTSFILNNIMGVSMTRDVGNLATISPGTPPPGPKS